MTLGLEARCGISKRFAFSFGGFVFTSSSLAELEQELDFIENRSRYEQVKAEQCQMFEIKRLHAVRPQAKA